MHTAVVISPHTPVATTHSTYVSTRKRATTASSFPSKIARVSSTQNTLASLPTTNKSGHRVSDEETKRTRAATRIQAGWRDWRARIHTARKYAAPDQQYVKTTTYPRETTHPSQIMSKTQRWGMINFTPTAGNGPTLSIYKAQGNEIGSGGEAVVLAAPRGFVERLSQRKTKGKSLTTDPRCYADLTSFQANTAIDECRKIGRYAGINLYDYLYYKSGVLTVADFQQTSQDLKKLHQRGLYHLDIKLHNMTFKPGKTKAHPPTLFFIDCDGITNQPNIPYFGTFFRHALASEAHNPIPATGRADDEYAFLLVLIHAADFSFASVYRRLAGIDKRASPELRQKLQHYIRFFVEKYIKAAFRCQVQTFLTTPTENNILRQPLHDMIDWFAPPDIICALQRGNRDAIKSLGHQALHMARTSEQKRDVLLAKNATGYPGLYWALKSNDIATQDQWEILSQQLSRDEQNKILNDIDALLKAKNA